MGGLFLANAIIFAVVVCLMPAGVAECRERSVVGGGAFRDVRPLPIGKAVSVGAAGHWDALQTQALLASRLHLCLQQLHQSTSSAAGETAHTHRRKGGGEGGIMLCGCTQYMYTQGFIKF